MTLEEYLVKLGWSVDEPSFKRFAGALAQTSARAAELSSTVLETASAMELMVSRIAQQYENLYYIGQRSNQTISYIQQTQFGFKQIGLSAEEANSSIEGIAATLRTQPWLRGIFGGASTPQQVADKLGKSGLPYFLQARFAEMIGMSERTLWQMQHFSQVEAAAQQELADHQRMAGLDPEQLSKSSTDFGRALRSLENDLGIVGDKIAQDWIGPLTTAITKMDEAVQWLLRVDNATNGWVTTLGALAGTIGGSVILKSILGKLFGFGGGGAAAAAAEAGGGAGAAGAAAKAAKVGGAIGADGVGLTAAGVFGGEALSGGVYGLLAAALAVVKQNDPETRRALQDKLGPLLYQLGMSNTPDLSGKNPKANIGSGNAIDRANTVAQAFIKAGYPAASAQGIAAGLYAESGLDPGNINKTSGASGIAQWLGSRKAAYRKMFLHDPSQGSIEENIQFILYELQHGEAGTGNLLRRGGLSSRQAAQAFVHGYERPGGAGEISDMSRAGPLADVLSGLAQQGNTDNSKSVNVNSRTNVTIQGGDTMSTAKAYEDAHNTANENMLRNLQGIMR